MGYGSATSDAINRLPKFLTPCLTSIKRIGLLPDHLFGVHKGAAFVRPYPLAGMLPPTPVATAQVIAFLRTRGQPAC